MNKTALPLVACVLLTLSPVSSAADDAAEAAEGSTFHHASHGYSLTLPAGWVRIPDDVVQRMMEALLEQNASITYDTGFQPAASAKWFQYPYVLTQSVPYSQMGLDRQIKENEMGQVIKALTGMDLGKQVKGALKDEVKGIVSHAQVGTVDLDRANHRFFWTAEMQVAGVGEVRGGIVGYFGRDSLVQVMFYSRSQDWERDADVRSQITGSLRFDPDRDYDEAAGKSGWLSGSKLLRDTLIGGLIGAATAGVLGALRSIRNRRRRTSQS
jgi:uncharacterized membrane-anchored protein